MVEEAFSVSGCMNFVPFLFVHTLESWRSTRFSQWFQLEVWSYCPNFGFEHFDETMLFVKILKGVFSIFFLLRRFFLPGVFLFGFLFGFNGNGREKRVELFPSEEHWAKKCCVFRIRGIADMKVQEHFQGDEWLFFLLFVLR